MAGRSLVAIPWYLRTDYARAQALFGDLPRTYDVWLRQALHSEQQCRARGMPVSRVVINSALFNAWCRENGKAPDSKARADFISRRAWTLMQP
jgi:hypothetical protein